MVDMHGMRQGTNYVEGKTVTAPPDRRDRRAFLNWQLEFVSHRARRYNMLAGRLAKLDADSDETGHGSTVKTGPGSEPDLEIPEPEPDLPVQNAPRTVHMHRNKNKDKRPLRFL